MYRSCLLFALAACSAAHHPTSPPAAPAAIDATIASIMKDIHVPGMAVAVVRDGHVVHARGYGVADLEQPTPVTTATRFQIASSTKVLTGTLVMLLVQDKLLELDRPVSAYLPDAPAAWQGMTVRQLAAHAAGIPDRLDNALVAVADAYAAAKAMPLKFPPGTRSQYGTGDFVVLAQILETIGGKSFEELLRTRVFEPLGFTCTAFDHAAEDGQVRLADVVPGRATVYRWTGDRQRSARFFYPAYTYASGGAFSCIDDLARWAAAMDRHTLLTADSEREMAAGFRIDGRDVGFGVVFSVGSLRGHRHYGHSGGPALADVLRIPDEKLTVIVLSNQQRLLPNLAARIAGDSLPPSAPPTIADPDTALTAKLRRVAEQYASGAIDEAIVAPAKRAELVQAVRTWGPIQLAALPPLTSFVPLGEHRYRATYGKTEVVWTFVLEDQLLVDLDVAID